LAERAVTSTLAQINQCMDAAANNPECLPEQPQWSTGSGHGNRDEAFKTAKSESYGKNIEKKSTCETIFVSVGLAFCALRVSIRV